MLEKEAKRMGYSWPMLHKSEYLEPVYKRYTLSSLDDLYITVGFGGLSTTQILNRLIEEYKKTTREPVEVKTVTHAEHAQLKKQTHHTSHGVMVAGEPGMLVRFAKCCTPLPGDAIIGYITRGRGVSVHRSDCVNMADFRQTPERLIDVQWEDNVGGAAYSAEIQIVGYDRIGLLSDISSLFVKMEVSIVALSARVDKNQQTIINVTLGIKNTVQLEKIIKQLLKRQDIIEVFRTSA